MAWSLGSPQGQYFLYNCSHRQPKDERKGKKCKLSVLQILLTPLHPRHGQASAEAHRQQQARLSICAVQPPCALRAIAAPWSVVGEAVARAAQKAMRLMYPFMAIDLKIWILLRWAEEAVLSFRDCFPSYMYLQRLAVRSVHSVFSLSFDHADRMLATKEQPTHTISIPYFQKRSHYHLGEPTGMICFIVTLIMASWLLNSIPPLVLWPTP